jgi:hypothetical protein
MIPSQFAAIFPQFPDDRAGGAARQRVVIRSQQPRSKATEPIWYHRGTVLYDTLCPRHAAGMILDSRRTNAHICGHG